MGNIASVWPHTKPSKIECVRVKHSRQNNKLFYCKLSLQQTTMLDFVQAEKELSEYTKYIIIHDDKRYVPAAAFEFLQRMYEEQKVYRIKLEEKIIEIEAETLKNRFRNKKQNIRKAKTELLQNYLKQ